MRNTFLLSLILPFVVILFTQCSKEPLPPKVYVAGIEFYNYYSDSPSSKAKLWINGAGNDLNAKYEFTEARSVTVSGGNVYVAGFSSSRSSQSVAILWKNNIPIYLPGEYGQALSVSVDGKDVYVSGTAHINGKFHGVIWKNGMLSYLTNGNEYGYSKIYATGGSLYATGFTITNGSLTPAILKNGLPINLQLPNVTTELTSVFVSGQNVYSTGNSYDYTSSYWKNGIRNIIGYQNTTANDVYTSGSDVYVTGRLNLYQVGLWKNSVPVPLETSYISEGFSVYVSGKNIYVVGIGELDSKKICGQPVIWTNGVKKILPTNSADGGFATSVFVY